MNLKKKDVDVYISFIRCSDSKHISSFLNYISTDVHCFTNMFHRFLTVLHFLIFGSSKVLIMFTLLLSFYFFFFTNY